LLTNFFLPFVKEFAAKEKLEIVKERGEPACGRAAPIRQTYLRRLRRQKIFELFSE